MIIYMVSRTIKIILTSLILIGLMGTASAEVFEFNNCGSSGHLGPDTGDCDYDLDNEVDIVDGGTQIWTVPETGIYEITAYGAAGADRNEGPGEGGKGAKIRGEFELEEGEEINIVVGQEGGGAK